jgi:hypothetical protein
MGGSWVEAGDVDLLKLAISPVRITENRSGKYHDKPDNRACNNQNATSTKGFR